MDETVAAKKFRTASCTFGELISGFMSPDVSPGHGSNHFGFSPPIRKSIQKRPTLAARSISEPLLDTRHLKVTSSMGLHKGISKPHVILIKPSDSKDSKAVSNSDTNEGCMESTFGDDSSSDGMSTVGTSDDGFPDLNSDINMERRFEAAFASHPAWLRQATAPGRLQIGGWTLDGEMTVIYEAKGMLTNSTVHSALATSCKEEEGCDEASAQSVAVKTVPLNGDQGDLEMMHREISILKGLGCDHPHVLPLLASETLDEHLIVLTRLAPDGDLSRIAPPGSCLAELETRRLSSQLLSALVFLEDRRVVHGDIKPSNILLTDVEGAFLAQLTDFGLAVKIPDGEQYLQLETVQGSYGFIPAEVKSLKQISFASDLFALGVTIFRLLSSYEPFYPASAVEEELLFDPHCWSPTSDQCQVFVRQLLSKAPKERSNAKELLQCHSWLTTDDEALAFADRTPRAPKTLEGVSFHNLEDSARHWSRLFH